MGPGPPVENHCSYAMKVLRRTDCYAFCNGANTAAALDDTSELTDAAVSSFVLLVACAQCVCESPLSYCELFDECNGDVF